MEVLHTECLAKYAIVCKERDDALIRLKDLEKRLEAFEKVNKDMDEPKGLKIWEESKEKANQKIVERVAMVFSTDKWRLNPSDVNDNQEFIDTSLKLIDDENQMKKSFPVKKYPIVLLTVNPDPKEWDSKVSEFVNIVLGIGKARSWLKDYMVAFEQREGADSEGYSGVHSHLLLYRQEDETVYEKRKLEKSICSYLNGKIWMKQSANFNQLNFKYIKETDKLKVMGYLMGSKKDDSKKEKQQKDISFRLEYKIDPIYIVGDKFRV